MATPPDNATSKPTPTIARIEDFLLNEPLYAPHSIGANFAEVQRLINTIDLKVDGFCPFCHDHTTFVRVDPAYASGGAALTITNVQKFAAFDSVTFRCARVDAHEITIWVRLIGKADAIQKVGQFPSLADVANDQAKQFRKVLSPQDSSELHRAIGLAAHGVGIGSFVYMRRVFERLIKSRFDEHKDAEKWTDEDWNKRRTDERIQLMKHHLPEFLVANSSVYGILSKGIHELDEDTCLAVFEVVKESIIEILEEDERKRQRVARQHKLTKSIQEVSAKIVK